MIKKRKIENENGGVSTLVIKNCLISQTIAVLVSTDYLWALQISFGAFDDGLDAIPFLHV